MRGLTEAISDLVDGQANAIVSVIGKRYTAEDLQAKKLSDAAAVFNDVGMTKKEREGKWRIE